MSESSSYLRHLPAVLWEHDPPPPAFSLGAWLRVFEKILTGIDDDVVMTHDGHEHDPLQDVISRLHRDFSPWTARDRRFLAWLATWVAIDEFPSIWDDYQARKVTSQIVSFYARRGVKEGLDEFLDLYTVARTRPRIAIDEGRRVLFARPERGVAVQLATLVSCEPLIAPLCIAAAPTGDLFVGDEGSPTNTSQPVEGGVWRLSPVGDYSYGGGPPSEPLRVGGQSFTLNTATALAVDNLNPWSVWVLDRPRAFAPPTTTVLWQFSSNALNVAVPIANWQTTGLIAPVDMAFDVGANKSHLLILDRGQTGIAPAQPRLVDVNLPQLPAAGSITTTSLNTAGDPLPIVEPLSLLVEANGDVLIGDAGTQNAATSAQVIRVQRTGPTWPKTALLPAANPLAMPAALVREDASTLLVLDGGLKPVAPTGNPFLRKIAKHAAVYRVDQLTTPATVTPATEPKQLVFPTGMAYHEGVLYIADRGEEPDVALVPNAVSWRQNPHRFGVVIHFVDNPQIAPTVRERRQIAYDIHQIAQRESPAHTAWSMLYTL